MHRAKRVVITGASQGVGRAVSRAFAAEGGRIALLARNTEALERAAGEVGDLGGEALVLPLDVADSTSVEAAADTVAGRWGGIDVWINCAMVSVLSPVKWMNAQEYRRVTEVTYLGYVHGTLAALRHMLPADSGVIIQIGSALAYRSIPLQSAYCAAKAAVRGFTDSLRCELAHDGSHVKVTMLQLPAVNTPQFDVVKSRMPNHPQPVPPIYQPEVIAKAVVHAAVHPAREMWVAPSAIQAILGQRLAPGLLDRYLGRTGYAAQQMSLRDRPGRPDNLWESVPGDRGAHGRFDDQSRSRSLEVWARTHRAPLALGVAAAGVVAGAFSRRRH
jgi:NAD(P)-dependent dehydrogenase (short-subunit alcohol dehydrogenase family)